MKKTTILVAITFLQYVNSNAQSLAVNTDGSTAHTSALLDVKSTGRGLLIPRMSKAQKNSIATPATGLLIFQNAPDSTGFHYYNGTDWTWLANSAASDDWKIGGNSNITSSNYIGTSNNVDLRFAANGIERTRLVSNSGFWGMGEFNPQYNMDISVGIAAINPCTRNGMRIKPFGYPNDCDKGFFVGLDDAVSTVNASVWNYGDGTFNAQSLRFGLNAFEMARLTRAGFLGLGEQNPQYTVDMKLGIAGVIPCTRNGIRLNNPSNNNDCDRGLFMGYDNNSLVSTASLWNFGDGSAFPSYIFRFGMGSDFTIGEKMRITINAVGIGNTNPLAKLHITDQTGTTMAGVMITNAGLPSGTNGFYAGLKTGGVNTARLWNYQNADIEFGSNDVQRMIIAASGEVGVATSFPPSSTLQVDGTLAVGVSTNITGGTIGSPTVISTQKSFLTLNPAGGNYYQLPNPATCVGRTYYIRNTDAAVTAQLGAAAGSICPGSGACLALGTYYAMSPAASGKTVIAISDGSSWVVGTIN